MGRRYGAWCPGSSQGVHQDMHIRCLLAAGLTNPYSPWCAAVAAAVAAVDPNLIARDRGSRAHDGIQVGL